MAQHPMKVVLLDLDGTLTKSDGGIIASVVKTFEELGRPVPDDAELHLALASCKPEYQCVPICEHFHLTELLDGIYGASRDNSRLDKDQVIRYCFDKIGFDAAAGDKAVMIGDRYTDIDGAHACNLDAIGCRWGYAPAGEMEEHGAYEIIEKPEQIEEAVNRYFQTH